MVVREGVEPIVGREQELRAGARFLQLAAERPAALLFEGEAGVGKTILWRHVLREAHDFRVLRCEATESESFFPLAGLVDLLGSIDESLIRALPRLQADALSSALLRAPATQERDWLALAQAVLGALRALSGERPVLVAVDDIQWLDHDSARIVLFALRRVEGPVGLLCTQRQAEDEQKLVALDEIARSRHPGRLVLGTLGVREIGLLVDANFDVRLSHAALRQLSRVSGGNPFYALEIAREITERSDLEPGGELPVPESLAMLLRRRIRDLSRETRELLVTAAVLARPTAVTLDRGGFTADAYAEAADAGVLTLDGDRVRFAHPLLASVARTTASPAELRAAHKRAANAVDDDMERTGHLALAACEPDDALAELVDHAAAVAAARGAPDTAAQLAERARHLTSTRGGDAWPRRTLAAAQYYARSGEAHRARRLLEDAVAAMPPGAARAELLYSLAQLEDDFERAAVVAESALAESAADQAVAARVHLVLGTLHQIASRGEDARRHAAEAARLAAAADQPTTEGAAWAQLAFLDLFDGHAVPEHAIERAVERHRTLAPELLAEDARLTCAIALAARDELVRARELLHEFLRHCELRGDEPGRAAAHAPLVHVELTAGDWQRAREYAAVLRGMAAHSGLEQIASFAALSSALVDAYSGAEGADDSITAADEALRHVGGDIGSIAQALRGFLALSTGDVRRAHTLCEPLIPREPKRLLQGLTLKITVATEIEALVGLGKLDRAATIVASLEAAARHALTYARPTVVAIRGRALIAGARGDLEAALRAAEQALRGHERIPDPFELARTLLVYGALLKRERRKADARNAFQRAHRIFADLGASLWEAHAQAEVGRLGLRRASGDELTPMERKVANTIARGATTKEAAAELFLSPKTIEFHLRNAYRKLGIRSRAELGRTLAGG
jgi:DNA-binding CsgD family transcriptional regulator